MGTGRSLGQGPVLLGLSFCVPALMVGFVFDDLIHRLMLEGKLPFMPSTWWSLYDFTDHHSAQELIELGAFPWFASPELSLRLFRPLSSSTLALDAALFGQHPLPAHLHTLVWFAALLLVASALYRRWLCPKVALWAAILYAISGVHALPTAWLASRHTLVAAVFSLTALWGWARWQEQHWRPGPMVAGVGIVLSLLASEAGLAGLAFLILYQAWSPRPWRARLAGMALFVGAAAIYLVAYFAAGYGIRDSGMYLWPLQAPGAYIEAAMVRVPLAYAELFGGAPSILAGADPKLKWILAGWGIMAATAAGATLLLLRRRIAAADRPQLLWLGIAAASSPLLLVGTAMSGRVLPVPMFGAAAIAAQALVAAWEILRDRSASARWIAPLPLFLFGGALGLLSPLTRLGLPLLFAANAKMHPKVAREADFGSCAEGGRVYLLTGADPSLSLYLGPSLEFYAPNKAHLERLRVLALVPQDLELTRVSDRAFDLSVLGPERRSNDFERLYRPPASPLEPGQTFRAGELRVKVLETSAGLFTKARFQFDRSLDSPQSCLVAWQNHRVAPLPIPPVGQSVLVRYEKGPAGM